jgi:hypothetical protein
MGSSKSAIAALLAAAAGCSAPGDTLYVDRATHRTEDSYSDKTKAAFISNLQKSPAGVDSVTRSFFGGLEGLPFDIELLEYKDDGKVREFRAAISGNPEGLYAALNLVRNGGDFLKWYIARLENDGLVKYHKAYKGIRNRDSGAESDTGVFYMLEMCDGSSRMVLADAKDAGEMKKRGIKGFAVAGTPEGALEKIKSGKLAELSRESEKGYKLFTLEAIGAEPYGWPVTEAHRTALKKLTKLDEEGKIRHFRTFKRVKLPESDGFYDFAILDKNGSLVLATEEDVERLAADTEKYISEFTRKVKLKLR